jgi:hypothetical protein
VEVALAGLAFGQGRLGDLSKSTYGLAILLMVESSTASVLHSAICQYPSPVNSERRFLYLVLVSSC